MILLDLFQSRHIFNVETKDIMYVNFLLVLPQLLVSDLHEEIQLFDTSEKILIVTLTEYELI